ncbi:MAG TPA: protein DA1 [Clostridia bacterium]|nr:protein DA1 [Clostridia bacterium]
MTTTLLVLASLVGSQHHAQANNDNCPVCLQSFGAKVFILTDAVTEEKKQICRPCGLNHPACFLCSLPVSTNVPGFSEFADGRFLCPRDARTAVKDDIDGLRACEETKDSLDRLLARFVNLPKNVDITVVDRVHMQELFRLPGRDLECPNVWGYFTTKTNAHRVTRQISLLSGLPLSSFKATCAHEYAHAWMEANLSSERQKTLDKDAREGFCELIAYMLMHSQGEELQKKQILRNVYTRGQIQLLVQAEHLFGFNDVVEWILSGTDARLDGNDLARIRSLKPSPAKPAARTLGAVAYAPARTLDVLTLQGITWNAKRPLALINGQTYEPGEEASLTLGTQRVRVRCLSISTNSVRIRLAGSGEERQLHLHQD